jgi:hypothetical protein
MTRRVRQPAVLALVAALVAPIAGCGGSDKKGDPIPRAQAALIVARLQEAKRRNDPLRCHDLQRDTIPALRDRVAALPAGTDSDVKQTLSDGIDHLNDLVSQECTQQQTTPTDTNTQPSVPSTPSTTETTPSTQTTNTNTQTNTNTNTNTDTNTNTGTSTTPAPGGTPGPGNGNGNGNGKANGGQ